MKEGPEGNQLFSKLLLKQSDFKRTGEKIKDFQKKFHLKNTMFLTV